MRGNSFPARQGIVWLLRGFALWRSALIPLTASAMTMIVCLILTMMIPLAGSLVFSWLLPVLAVGMFTCCQSAARKQRIMPGLLFRHFGQHMRSLLGFAILRTVGNLACLTLALLITGTHIGDVLPQFLPLTPEATDAVMDRLTPVIELALVLSIPLDMAVWFAAPLRALRNIPLGKSLFFSFIACWRNLLPLFVFLLGYGIAGLLLPFLLMQLIGLAIPALASMLLAPALMLLAPVFHGGFYQSACDIFGDWPEEK